jgi:hypothetical protein
LTKGRGRESEKERGMERKREGKRERRRKGEENLGENARGSFIPGEGLGDLLKRS